MRVVFLGCGTLCVVLAIAGLVLPVLPTTPWLLLAAACYARSSDRFYHWLLSNRWFGVYLRHYREGKGIPLKQKILTLLVLWGTIGLTVGFAVRAWYIQLVLVGVAVGVTLHLSKIKTFKPDGTAPQEVQDTGRPDRSRSWETTG